ncbi:MAG: peptide-methionine (S)-S-oxide reductase MsrA [Planctomycetota bacterium]
MSERSNRISALRSLLAAIAAGLALSACSGYGPGGGADPYNDPDTGESNAAPSSDAEAGTTGSDASETSASIALPTPDPTVPTQDPAAPETGAETPMSEVATLGAGCYWCIEAVLEQIDGVESVVSGFMGGQVDNPSYREVCAGTTGHAEVVQVTFDPGVISYEELLDWFWRLHDPTTLNRQGADVGTQYRSAIFTHSPEQAEAARRSLEAAQPSFEDPIVTEIADASTFYEAPDYHQGYYQDNRSAGYCRVVIRPKLKKLGLKE